MTAKYEREISFQYPENWSLEEDPPRGLPRTISVTSAVGAFWSATVYGGKVSLDELQKEYLESFRQEYTDLELDPVEIQVNEERLSAIDIQFYCLDLLVHSRLIALPMGQFQVLIAWQAEDRDFDKLEPVFQAITFSALQNAARP